MKIISYNVNGIRSALRKGLADWIAANDFDIICFQETKAHIADIPIEIFTDLGYHTYWHSAQKKGYSGVGIISKQPAKSIKIGCDIPQYDHEGRVLIADFDTLSVMSVYMPSGSGGDERQAFKMQFLADFKPFAEQLLIERPKLIISGDYNICHKAIDIHDPIRNANASGFLPEERHWMDTFFTENGFVDTFRLINPTQKDSYSWWSFRANARQNNKGWRIDYHAVSQVLRNKVIAANILPNIEHADHCPIFLELNDDC